MDDEPRIEALSVLSLRPGDTLIVRCDHIVSAQEIDWIKNTVRSQLTVDVPVLVTSRGVSFTVARPEELS